jgi:hypothetical protein
LSNREDWQRLEWVDDMVYELTRDKHFRWFDSGDMYSLALAEKICEVMRRTPWVKHWLPTRMHKFPKFALVLREMSQLDNVMVRPSSDSIIGEFISGLHGSVIVPDSRVNPDMVKLCRAYENDGKCSGCRACYSKDIPVIAYPAHGKTMAKVIRIKVAA